VCRSIKVLRRPEPVATTAEIEAAALQFVRKVSGTRKPSAADIAMYDQTVREIAECTQRLLNHMKPPRVRRKVEETAEASPA
jgi:hypothetical protein